MGALRESRTFPDRPLGDERRLDDDLRLEVVLGEVAPGEEQRGSEWQDR